MGFGRAPRAGLAIRLMFTLQVMTAIGMVVMGLYATRAIEIPLLEHLTTSMIRDARLIHEACCPICHRAPPLVRRKN